jgi:ATP adenylyltransferase
MDYLFTPWRRQYVVEGVRETGCVFCRMSAEEHGADHLLGTRHWYAVLNAFPYCNGHLMLVARRHLAWLSELETEAQSELVPLLARLERAIRLAYRPEGMNLGVNVSQAGGAGIPEHLHIHMLPRWAGDTNFMTTVNHARVIPEDLGESFERLRKALDA